MSFPKRRRAWGSKSQAVKQWKILQKGRKGALRSRQERVANEILMYFRSQRKLQGEVSLADTLEASGEGGALSLMDVISVDDTMLDDLAAGETYAQLHRLVRTCLTPREAAIIEQRYGLGGKTPKTQREIAAACGISRSYVSRIEKRALEKLRQGLQGPPPAAGRGDRR